MEDRWRWQEIWHVLFGAAVLFALQVWVVMPAVQLITPAGPLAYLALILVPPFALGMLVSLLPGWEGGRTYFALGLFLLAIFAWVWHGSAPGMVLMPEHAFMFFLIAAYFTVQGIMFTLGAAAALRLKTRFAKGAAGA